MSALAFATICGFALFKSAFCTFFSKGRLRNHLGEFRRKFTLRRFVPFAPKRRKQRPHSSENGPASNVLKIDVMYFKDHREVALVVVKGVKKLSSTARQESPVARRKEGECAFQLDARCSPERFPVLIADKILAVETELVFSRKYREEGSTLVKGEVAEERRGEGKADTFHQRLELNLSCKERRIRR